MIPVKHTHLDTESSLLSAAPRWLGERRGVTQVDLLAVCQVSGFTGCAADLAPADYAGDANGDNRVDAADYVALRNDPTPLGPEYQVWQDNFGQTFELPPGGEAASVLAGVPEPATAALTAAATLALSVRRRTAQPSGRASRGRSQAASPPRAPSPWCV